MVAVHDPAVRQVIGVFYFSTAFPRHLQLRFNTAVIELLPAIPNIVKKYEPPLPRAVQTSDLRGRPLTLDVLKDALIVQVAGTIASLLVLMMEVMRAHMSRRTVRYKYDMPVNVHWHDSDVDMFVTLHL